MAFYRNKYRIPSARWQCWNYAGKGGYFITICTKNRHWYFGNVISGQMHHSDIGQIAWEEWYKTPDIRPDMNLELGAFVVMPNHIHGILIIGGNPYNVQPKPDQGTPNQFGPQQKNLASVIRGYKSAVTSRVRKIPENTVEFAWQERFYDHVIRTKDSYRRISEYIDNNPAKWEEDKFYG